MKVARFEPLAARLTDGTVLVAGGYPSSIGRTTETYDPVTDTWTAAGDLHLGRTAAFTLHALPGGRAIVIGGGYSPTTATTELYDPLTRQWSPGPPLNQARAFHASVMLTDGRILVAGGSELPTSGITLRSCELYDPVTNSWSPTGSLRDGHSTGIALLADGRVLLSGSNSTPFAATEIYDPRSGTWTVANNTGRSTSARTGVLLASGEAVFPASTAVLNIFNVTTGTWRTSSLQNPINQDIVGLGGGSHVLLPDAWPEGLAKEWRAATETWRTVGPTIRLIGPGVVALNRWTALIAGGSTTDNVFLSSARLYHKTCTDSTECPCVGGYCCESACDGGCGTCTSPGHLGSCRPVTDGTASAAGRCGTYRCDGARVDCPTTCTSRKDCAADHYCRAGACVPEEADGALCDPTTICASGFCVDGRCCADECSAACGRCDVAGHEGRCTPVPEGTETSCAEYLCDGAEIWCPASCASDAACTAPFSCRAGVCVLRDAGEQCAAGTQCASGYCVDGYCCDGACTGACDRCDRAGSEGTCGAEPAGLPVAACAPYLCDGNGGACPTTCARKADCAGSAVCFEGQCVAPRTAGETCSADDQCTTGHCADGVCCNRACDGACARCDLAGSKGVCRADVAGTAPRAGTCVGWLCAGTSEACPSACASDGQCSADAWCDGGRCVPQTANGQRCSVARQCHSGFCTDGVCCNRACTGSCEACDAAGARGQCRVRLAGDSGRRDACGAYVCDGVGTTCPVDCSADSQCAAGHACDAGACTPLRALGEECARAGTCASGRCADGVCCDASCGGGCDRCDLPGHEGQCRAVTRGATGNAPACTPFVCDGATGSCPSSCTADDDCVSAAWCTGFRCEPRAGLGTPCTEERSCLSGFCIDGVCCDGACEGQCASCGVPGFVGRCSAVTGAPRNRPVCGGTGACAGACDGSTRDRCVFPDADVRCGTPSCAAGEAREAARCDGAGACVVAPATPCGAFACEGPTCATTCIDAGDCAPDHWCENGACRAALPLGTQCGADTSCVSGHCAAGVCCDSACAGGCESCDATGHCHAAEPGALSDCAPLLCSGRERSCPATCDADGDCAAGLRCREGRCVPPNGPGAACSAQSDCASTFCVDGVCCDRACDGQCETCGSNGTCSVVTGAAFEGREPCAGEGACRGTCDGTSPDCVFPDAATTCSPGFCSQWLATAASVCDGAGHCSDGAQTICPAGCEAERCASFGGAAASGCASQAGGWPSAVCALLLGVASRRRARRR